MRRHVAVSGGTHVIPPRARKKIGVEIAPKVSVDVLYVVVPSTTSEALLLHHDRLALGKQPAVLVLSKMGPLYELFSGVRVLPGQTFELDVENTGREPADLCFGIVGMAEWPDEPHKFLSPEEREKLLRPYVRDIMSRMKR